MLNEKVSVIVPIYKVEKYIHRCIDSILKQTYSNLEVILVDDGSPDNCGEIADEYASKDQRVVVVHKENGGLSDARNAGMKYINGEFIVFVDSDDWIEKNMIERMVHTSLKYKADVVQSAFYYAYDDKRLLDNRYSSTKDEPVILDNRSLMYELVTNEKVKNFAWGKLYKARLIQDIPFKKGVLFEDVFWAHKVMHRVDTYVMIHEPLYHYYQREDSIVATYTPKNLDILKGLKERHIFIEKYYEELTDESYQMIIRTSLIHYNLLFKNWKKGPNKIYRTEIQSYILDNCNDFKNAIKKDKQLKIQIQLFIMHPYIYLFYLGIRKVLSKMKLTRQPVGLKMEVANKEVQL